MQFPPRLAVMLDTTESQHPIDPVMREIVAQCIENAGSLPEAVASINTAFAAASERLDILNGVVTSLLYRG